MIVHLFLLFKRFLSHPLADFPGWHPRKEKTQNKTEQTNDAAIEFKITVLILRSEWPGSEQSEAGLN